MNMTYNIPEDYELNEKDIDSTINWLWFTDPENANPETAIDFLIYLRTVVHQGWHDDPKEMEARYKKYRVEKKAT